MADVTIEVRKNGAYRVTGEFKLIDHEGNPIPLPPAKPGKDWVSLCRCGASVTKPFCDGTHSKIGFLVAAEVQQQIDAAVPESKPPL
jgi:3-phenylpropionate/trans-cinnamate dioxygenase ferredoxin subunit